MAVYSKIFAGVCEAAIRARLDKMLEEWAAATQVAAPELLGVRVQVLFSPPTLLTRFEAAVQLHLGRDGEDMGAFFSMSEAIWLPEIEPDAQLLEPYFDAMGQVLAWRGKLWLQRHPKAVVKDPPEG